MKITDTSVSFASAHSASQTLEIQESLRVRVAAPASVASPLDSASISPEASSLQSMQGTGAVDEEVPPEQQEVELQILSILLFRVGGRQYTQEELRQFLKDWRKQTGGIAVWRPQSTGAPATQPAQQAPSVGMLYERKETRTEQEALAFSASGVIKTADGKEIAFKVSLAMSRSFVSEQNIRIVQGNAAAVEDPIVVNFRGNAAQLTSNRFSFDLDSDGTKESVPTLADGSAFLVLDKNGNGQVDNGGELFGPSTGNGFSEMKTLDADGNQWLDESDAAFSQLRLWTPTAEGGGELSTLAERGIGALLVSSVATPFTVKDSTNDTLGQVRATSAYVSDTGGTGTVQQVDVKV